MQSIAAALNSSKLENPDLNMLYSLPKWVEEYTGKMVRDNGCNYLDRVGQRTGRRQIWPERVKGSVL